MFSRLSTRPGRTSPDEQAGEQAGLISGGQRDLADADPAAYADLDISARQADAVVVIVPVVEGITFEVVGVSMRRGIYLAVNQLQVDFSVIRVRKIDVPERADGSRF